MAGFNNIELITDRPLEDNLKEIEEVKKHFPNHAIIASLMVESREEWHQIIKDVENSGADGIELNFGCPHGMCERGMGSAVGQEPAVLQTIVEWVMEVAQIPVITKLTPNISHIVDPGLAAVRGGSDAISLINTLKSIVGIDLDTYAPYPVVDGKGTNGGYCGPAVKPIALDMVKELAKHPEIKDTPISGIGGIETWRDAVEFILLGAGSVQVCTAVMHYGFGIVREMKSGLEQFMLDKGYETIDRIPEIIEENCVGCNLCALVCPVEDCITMVQKDDGSESITWEERSLANNIPTTFNDDLAGGKHHYVPTVEDALKWRK